MTLDWSFTHGGSEEDPRNEFNIGKQFENKEEVMLAVKRYIKRAVEYKILKINQLRCTYPVFWTFPPCVEAFKHCKPLIFIDGTHLYSKYGGTLLMAIAQDGNANILPIVYVVVEGETKEAWTFFLSYLRQHVTPQHDVLVISDKYKSIDAALNVDRSLWKPPHAFQAFCTRQIAASFMTHFKNKDLKKVMVNATYSKLQRGFAYYFGCLRDVDEGHRIQLKHVNTMNVYQFDRSRTMFKVEELAVVPGSRQQNYQVLFDEGMCDCGYFQALHVLCRHVLAACSHARFDWK
ncbi:hypothetical protein AHAS_Ahas12G0216200 [Arachis hypogaea]